MKSNIQFTASVSKVYIYTYTSRNTFTLFGRELYFMISSRLSLRPGLTIWASRTLGDQRRFKSKRFISKALLQNWISWIKRYEISQESKYCCSTSSNLAWKMNKIDGNHCFIDSKNDLQNARVRLPRLIAHRGRARRGESSVTGIKSVSQHTSTQLDNLGRRIIIHGHVPTFPSIRNPLSTLRRLSPAVVCPRKKNH